MVGTDAITFASEGPMSSVQGIGAASYSAPKNQAASAPKLEAKETAQDERNEVLRGTQEAGERQAAPPANASVGSRFSATA